jgi:hypothetical protein
MAVSTLGGSCASPARWEAIRSDVVVRQRHGLHPQVGHQRGQRSGMAAQHDDDAAHPAGLQGQHLTAQDRHAIQAQGALGAAAHALALARGQDHGAPRGRRAHACSWSRSGSCRMRLPVAAKMALNSAGATGGTGGSPTPPGGTSWLLLTR